MNDVTRRLVVVLAVVMWVGALVVQIVMTGQFSLWFLLTASIASAAGMAVFHAIASNARQP
jgi:hypothetical protein